MVDDQTRNVAGTRQAGTQAEWLDVTQPGASDARVLARLGLTSAKVVAQAG